MKRYTTKTVSRWLAAQNFIRKERQPSPFPGKAPTRIMINAIAGKRRFSYLGKPSRQMHDGLLKFCRKPVVNQDFTIYYVEFDKKGIINFGKNSVEWGPTIKTNLALWTHYHLEVKPDVLPTWLNYKHKVVDGKYKII